MIEDQVPEADIHLLQTTEVTIRCLCNIMLRHQVLLYSYLRGQCDMDFMIATSAKLTEDCHLVHRTCVKEIDRYIIIHGAATGLVPGRSFIYDTIDICQSMVKGYLQLLQKSTSMWCA